MNKLFASFPQVFTITHIQSKFDPVPTAIVSWDLCMDQYLQAIQKDQRR